MSSTIHVILASGLKAGSELLLNVVTSGVIEGVFPPFNPKRSPWLNLIEGSIEITLYLLIAGTASNALAELFGDAELVRLPYGSLLMFWLLEGAVAKVGHFVSYISSSMNKRRVPVKPIVLPGAPESPTDDTPTGTASNYDADGNYNPAANDPASNPPAYSRGKYDSTSCTSTSCSG